MPQLLVITAAAARAPSEPRPSPRPTTWSTSQAICADTTTTIDALPQPPEEIPVAAFASSAASALDDEAERVACTRGSRQLADDHRAFIRNTDEQCIGVAAPSPTAGDDELGELTVRVGELIRGRNDLASEMGAPGCRRGDV